jgi:hypothetical protein
MARVAPFSALSGVHRTAFATRANLIECIAMTKLERAIKEAEQLPDEVRERLGDDLLHYIHKYLALQDALDEGLRELDAGETVDGETLLSELKAQYGA